MAAGSPRRLGLKELSTASGRTITYQDETLKEAYASRATYGAPDWELAGWVTSYAAIAAGELDLVSDAVHQITGTPPAGLRAGCAPTRTRTGTSFRRLR